MLDRLGHELFGSAGLDPGAILHDEVTQALEVSETEAKLRLALPLAQKGEISLKKIGAELIVRVDGHKRMVMLPAAMAGFEPRGARFEDGVLEVSFSGSTNAGSDNGRR
jgi:arsenite-transporting ATPase